MIITIDGPAASGKSTVAQKLAKRCGYFYLNTGALYRAFAYVVHTEKMVDADVVQHAQAICDRISYMYDGDIHVCYDGYPIPFGHLETPLIARVASCISAIPEVRASMNRLQRLLVKKHKDVVVDGRDSGSVVFAHADYKFFITADDAIRALRWQKKQKSQGIVLSLEQAQQAILERDARDKHRAIAPLVIPDGAKIFYNNAPGVDKLVSELYAVITKK